MDGCTPLGHGRGFLRVISGANLLINIIEGPRKFSSDFATGFSGSFRTRLPKGTPLVPGQKFKTSITSATGVRFWPTNYQNEAIDDECISSISDFAPNNINIIRPQPGKLLDGWMQSFGAWEGFSSCYFG